MSEFKASGFRDEFGNAGPDLVGITTMTSPYYFVPPSGTTAERPSGPPPGMLRFNTDIGRLEVWRNDHWATILGESPNLGNQNAGTSESRVGTGVRGVFAGNRNTPTAPSSPKSEYISLSTFGNAVDFGSLTQQVAMQAAFASRTRGVFAGGYCHPVAGVRTARIAGFTFASTGSHEDFSSVISNITQQSKGLANQTRGVIQHGNHIGSIVNVMEYVTISSIANAVDFGDLNYEQADGIAVASAVRGIFAGGYNPSTSSFNNISYITISTTGNAQDFGDLTEPSTGGAGGGNATRGIRMAGLNPSASDVIDFITISTTGNAQDFGDLHFGASRNGCQANVSSPIRSIYAGGTQSSNEDAIQAITNATTGASIDFGNLTEVKFQFAGASNGHGGL